jgi:uncharacterized integral membrane protein
MSDDASDAIQTVDDAPRPSAPRQFVESPPRSLIPDEPGFLRKNLGATIWGVVLVLLAVFIGQNWREVKVDVFFWSFDIELSWALIAAAFAGIILGWLVPLIWKRSRRNKNAANVNRR